MTAAALIAGLLVGLVAAAAAAWLVDEARRAGQPWNME